LESVKSATEEYQRLSKEIFPNVNLGLLHGQMKSSQKEKILQQMSSGEIDILVATPVVEVGIDIPNANFMIIEAANRFGLAQLHQLRGRIGRGNKQAYCFLFAQKIGKKAKRRLTAMENINDGLKLAEIDLKIRGPGEIYGTKQHGYPELKIASYNDIKMIEKTRKTAAKILAKNPNLDQYPQLKQTIYNGRARKPLAQN
jgi:ATP-dependent DNA helicase RecG